MENVFKGELCFFSGVLDEVWKADTENRGRNTAFKLPHVLGATGKLRRVGRVCEGRLLGAGEGARW